MIHSGAAHHSSYCACPSQGAGAFSVLRQQVFELGLKALDQVPSGIRPADVCTVTGHVKICPTKWTSLFSVFHCLGDLHIEPQAKKKKIQIEQGWKFFMKL